MSASKKAAKKPAAKKAVKPATPKKAQPKAKPAVTVKKTVATGIAKKPAANVKKVDSTKPSTKAPTAPVKKTAVAPGKKTASNAVPAKTATAAVKGKQTKADQPVKTGSKTAPAAKQAVTSQAGKPAADKKKEGKKKTVTIPQKQKQAKAPASGTKSATASSPANLRSPAQASAARAKNASKKARPTFVKQSSSSKQDNNQPSPELDAKTKELVLSARKRTTGSAAPKPNRGGKGAPIAFTMDDVAQVLAKKQTESSKEKAEKAAATTAKVVKKQEVDLEVPQEKRVHSAVSLSDILGFNPAEKKAPAAPTSKGREVPRKWSRYHKLLVDLREQVSNVLEQHTAETLKRSNRDDSGDLSGYGQHMADAGTDTFDRDFALSMVSSEQEALFEISEAIERIYNGSYGVCEITNEPISAERLEAVPFTRYSLEGQKELEKNKRQKIQRGGVFSDNEYNISFDDDDN